MQLPNNWACRPYQDKLWQALAHRRIKRVVAAWHRRSGKDDIALNWTATAAFERVGTYWHLLPQANQARKAIWDALIAGTVDDHITGMRRIDQAFPKALRLNTREQDMLIRFQNGSTWQVVGSDNYNSLVGSPPVGVVFSEYALADPNAWAFLRPILAENGGWAMFISTPRGRNHFHRIYQLALQDPLWFGERLTVEQTGGVISPETIEQERRELVVERGEDEANDIIRQEYYCDFDAAIPGSYYGRAISRLEQLGRVSDLVYDPRKAVITAWDIGVGDSTAIWFVQQFGNVVHVIDFYENSGVGADHYARVIKERDYGYEGHILPHDVDDREWGNNASSRKEVLKDLKVKPIRVMPRASLEDGINAVRVLLPRCRFANTPAVEQGLNALRQYQKRWDEKLRVYSNTPLHDWTSHAADAFRYLAQGLKDEARQTDRPRFAITA